MPARMCRRLRYDCGERLRPAVHFRHIRRIRHESFAPQSLPAVGPQRCGRATAGRFSPRSPRRRSACLPQRISIGLHRIWRQSCVPESFATAEPMAKRRRTGLYPNRSEAGLRAYTVACFNRPTPGSTRQRMVDGSVDGNTMRAVAGCRQRLRHTFDRRMSNGPHLRVR